MTAAEHRRIQALTELVTEALDEPAPPPEVVALQERFKRLSRRQQGRVIMAMRLQETADFIAKEKAALEPYEVEIDAARRWALDMGRTARKGGAR